MQGRLLRGFEGNQVPLDPSKLRVAIACRRQEVARCSAEELG